MVVRCDVVGAIIKNVGRLFYGWLRKFENQPTILPLTYHRRRQTCLELQGTSFQGAALPFLRRPWVCGLMQTSNCSGLTRC